MYENSSLKKFISKSYANSKSNAKYQENGHFDVWFLNNSKKFQKNSKKNTFFF